MHGYDDRAPPSDKMAAWWCLPSGCKGGLCTMYLSDNGALYMRDEVTHEHFPVPFPLVPTIYARSIWSCGIAAKLVAALVMSRRSSVPIQLCCQGLASCAGTHRATACCSLVQLARGQIFQQHVLSVRECLLAGSFLVLNTFCPAQGVSGCYCYACEIWSRLRLVCVGLGRIVDLL